MNCDRDRFNQRRMRKEHVIRQMISNPRRHGNKLRKCAIAPERRGRNSNYFAVVAEVNLAALTEEALTAVNSRVERHPVATPKVLDRAAHGFNDSGCLMSHHHRRKPPARAAIVPMHVAPADPASADAYQQLIFGRPRGRQIQYLELLISGEYQRFHFTSILLNNYLVQSQARHHSARSILPSRKI